MTLKQKYTLVGLDIISIILSLIQIAISSLIVEYSTSNNIKMLFIFIGIICIYTIYKSVKCILNDEK